MAGKKGKFLVIEGIDGSGKGTLIGALRVHLVNEGTPPEDILTTAEPTTGVHGQRIRKLLRMKGDPHSNSKTLLNLYLADRKEHLENEILPALGQGKIVLCDRYKYSTIVYQSAQGLSKRELIDAHVGMPVPNLVIVLDLPVEEALKRISSDESRAENDIFEQKEFLGRVREGFLALGKDLPKEKITVIDATGPREKVFEKVLNAAKKVLK